MLTRERIVELVKMHINYEETPASHIAMFSEAILAEMDEPLWELADRKNCWIETNQNRNLSKRIMVYYNQQVTGLDHVDPKEFRAPTYAAAEAKAREFLATLPDRETK